MIAIIAVLIGLLLPAVQKVREASARMSCANNLKQIGLAFQNHHDQLGFLPHGGEHWSFAPDYDGSGNPISGTGQRAGWGFQILPFIEQDNLWKGSPGTTVVQKQTAVISTPVKQFFCPSRRAPAALQATDSWYGPGGTYPHAPTDYAGCVGTNNNGAVVYNPGTARNMINLVQISDGTSNTILVGEKALDLTYLGQYQSDDNEGYTSGWDHDVIRQTDRAAWPDQRRNISHGDLRFGGPHGSGFVAVLCDGSVRSVSFTMDATTFARAGERNDGQPLSNW